MNTPLRASIILSMISLLPQLTFPQRQATLLIITNQNSTFLLDGEEKGRCQPNTPLKVTTTEGEHYLQVQYASNGQAINKGQIVTLEAGKQKIVQLLFDSLAPAAAYGSNIRVADLNFFLPGSVTVELWKSNNPNSEYPYPVHYAAFEKGDEIILNVSMTNKKGTNMVVVATYPNRVIKYTNNGFSDLEDVRIKVEERSIYSFTFATNHAFDRNCLVQINRRPASAQTASFNTNVSKQIIYKPVTVIEPTALRVNSGSNADFKGGKSRILVPVALPPNTAYWFYRFSASRNQEDIDNVRKNFQLFGELTQLILSATGAGAVASKAVGIGVDQLSMPPGSNHCDVYLLDYTNITGFEAKTDSWQYILQGTRTNLMSGNVKIECCNSGQYYLGIKNPDYYDGINVSMEVIAITATEDLAMEAN